MYLRNHFVKHFGEGRMVNDITDNAMEEYIDIRMKRCKKENIYSTGNNNPKTFLQNIPYQERICF